MNDHNPRRPFFGQWTKKDKIFIFVQFTNIKVFLDYPQYCLNDTPAPLNQ